MALLFHLTEQWSSTRTGWLIVGEELRYYSMSSRKLPPLNELVERASFIQRLEPGFLATLTDMMQPMAEIPEPTLSGNFILYQGFVTGSPRTIYWENAGGSGYHPHSGAKELYTILYELVTFI